MLYRFVVLAALAIVIAGCGSSNAGPTPTPTPGASPVATAPAPTPTVVLNPAYMAFLSTICQAFRAGNSGGVTSHLMNYQYNSGLRWGMYGDGEGHTSDPSLMSTWLAGSHVKCRQFSPSVAGHGTLLTSGWSQPAKWGLLDLDLLNGQWTINDFTFGAQHVVAHAMHAVEHPVLKYSG